MLRNQIDVPDHTGSLDSTSDWMAHALAESSLPFQPPRQIQRVESGEAFVDCTCLLGMPPYGAPNPEFCRRAPPAGACNFWTQKSNQGVLES